MTLQDPDAGELDGERVADELLMHLQAEPDLKEASIADTPVRLMGGFDTLIYAFQLDCVPQRLAGPLVVRVFAEPGGHKQAAKEALFQNAVAAVGHPVPRVLVVGGRRTIGGRAFNVMERVPGHPLMQDMGSDLSRAPRVAELLAQTHTDLHALPSGGVANAVRNADIPLSAVTLEGGFRSIRRYVTDAALAHLEPGVEWLIENRPVERDVLSVCHGDFHPGNVMVDGERVTGVLDWSGAQLGDPERDVAVTLVLTAVMGPALAEGAPAGIFEAFGDGYLQAYSRRRTLDPGRLDYYRAYRVLHAFLRGTAARTPGVDPALLPRDQYPWGTDGALLRLVGVFRETTGVDLPVPAEVEAG